MRTLRRPLAAACAAAALLAGCGAERADPVDPTVVAPPVGTRELRLPAAGMRLTVPANWRVERRRAPAVVTLRSGTAIVSVFAYRRAEPVPRTDAALAAARERLLREVRERDPRIRALSARATRVDGALAIDVRAEQTIARRRLRTRSVHVFKGSAEYVVEALAEPEDFARVERGVLAPLLESAELTGRVAQPRRRRR